MTSIWIRLLEPILTACLDVLFRAVTTKRFRERFATRDRLETSNDDRESSDP